MELSETRVELRLVDRGNLKAFADLTVSSALGEITLKGFRVIQKDGESPWVGFPTSSYPKGGEIVNRPLLEVRISAKSKMAAAVLAEFEKARKDV